MQSSIEIEFCLVGILTKFRIQTTFNVVSYFANQPTWNSTTVPGLLQMSHPNGKLSRMSPIAIFSCILLRKNMRKKPPDKYYPPLRYYLALVIVCTVLMYCKQIKAVGNRRGARGKIRPPPRILKDLKESSKTISALRLYLPPQIFRPSYGPPSCLVYKQ